MPITLLVEDDEPTRRALIELVERRGFSTVAVGDLEGARRELAARPFDVVMLDVYLPEGSGIDLLLEIPKERRPQILLMSGDDAVQSAFSSLPFDELHFLQKPVDPKDLHRLLQQVRRRCQRRERDAAAAGARILGESAPIRKLRKLVAKVAPSELSVYIEGESGTGKELIARAIHAQSARADGPFVAINCGAIPESLVDSELFGHEQGAFTGADAMRQGVFERASGGTLFLDEIAEMPVDLQVRLLRALETRRVTRVGGKREIEVDVRIVAATNRSFEQAIADGTMREDLFHRLCVFPIVSPPLRDRGDDVLELAASFLREFGGDVRLDEPAEAILRAYRWPGNVRQLRNAMQHAAVLAEGDVVGAACLPGPVRADVGAPDDSGAVAVEASEAGPSGDAVGSVVGEDGERVSIPVGSSIAEAERRLIEATLARHEGDKKATAEVLGVSLRTLYNRLSEYSDDGDGDSD